MKRPSPAAAYHICSRSGLLLLLSSLLRSGLSAPPCDSPYGVRRHVRICGYAASSLSLARSTTFSPPTHPPTHVHTLSPPSPGLSSADVLDLYTEEESSAKRFAHAQRRCTLGDRRAMLAWLVKEVESPYGDVATLHWAVPDADDGADLDGLNSTALKVELESAEDQLGAVLWNSNTAALRHLHEHIFKLPLTSLSPAPQASPAAPLAGKNIVELGAGVGCLGIALAMGGARVVITDLKELLPLMEYNVRLNEKRVQTRSGGVGLCVALQWKWGPTVSTAVHKQLQREKLKVSRAADERHQQRSPCDNTASSTSSEFSNVVHRVVSSMVSSLLAPSACLTECKGALRSLAAGSSPTAASLKTPLHYVILCDALYGNPKDWPALLYTLTELIATNPDECEVINFCEQRVDDVEGTFLSLLDAENAQTFVSMESRQRDGDALWTNVVDSATRCSESPPTSEAGQYKQREAAASSLLCYARVQRRGAYRWAYTTKVLQDSQSELNMVIRVTRIRWTRARVVEGEEAAPRHKGGIGHRVTASISKFGVPERPRRQPRDHDMEEDNSAPAADNRKRNRSEGSAHKR
ncbi:hypothetical protein LSCM1_05555 [Leishmania martiniquensis]|uniref:Methyltransferase n=1 Tax=Leishmania martiniquensis TaxID=1580590 RepID=A0A836KP26_9TRYP|nr:hypothetical protein LSCM1_05555 [Leishmania martiniquensis]